MSIAHLKRAIARFAADGNVAQPITFDVSSERGDLSLQFGLTRHAPGMVMCMALTRTPVPVSAWRAMDEFIEGFNRSSAIRVVADSECERLMAAVLLPIDEFLKESDAYLSVLLLSSLPESLFVALDLLKRIDAGAPVSAVMQEHEASLIAMVNANGLIHADDIRASDSPSEIDHKDKMNSN